MRFKLLDGVAIIYPWCNHGTLKVVVSDEGAEVTHMAEVITDKDSLDRAMVRARELANGLARTNGESGYGEIQLPPCVRCKPKSKEVARRVSHGVPVTPHL